MSQIYSTEPQTSGQVVFETTHGPLSIHLWCKECPSTTRYFLQLCIDGYYDNLVFHRIVPNFLIQTGDAQYRQDGSNSNAATGKSNNDPYRQPPPPTYRQQHQSLQAYERRKYELNSRIRFNHRGQVAMALPIDAADDENNDNESEVPRLQPQFFITLGEASHLDGKHVCFGGVTGPTVFNALRIGQTDVYDEDEGEGGASLGAEPYQPRFLNEAPRIIRTKVLAVDLPPTVPPLVPTIEPPLLPWRVSLDSGRQLGGNGDALTTAAGGSTKNSTKKRARKGVKNVNLLSFGGDEELVEEEEGLDNDGTVKVKKSKIQSSHDVLATKSDKGHLRVERRVEDDSERRVSLHQDEDIDVSSRQPESNEVTNKEQNELPHVTEPTVASGVEGTAIEEALNSKNNKFVTQIPKADEKTTTMEPFKPSKIVTEAASSVSQQPKKMSLVEARRARYASKIAAIKPKTKTDRQQREIDTMAKFMAFQKKIIQQQAMSGDDKKKKHQSVELNDNSKGDNNDDNHDEHHRRDKKKEKKKEPSKQHKESRGLDTTGYHGQVLEPDIDEEVEGNGEWIQTKFKCRRHIDLDARMGGDGRTVDDYEVVEERNSATDRKYDRKKSKHHHL